MTTISSAGIGSGLDVDALVTKLMEVERQPLTNIDKKEASYQAKLSAFGTLKSALADFQTAAKALSTPAQMSPLKTSVADATVMSASAGSGAVAGSYDIEVKSLAQAQKLVSGTGYAATTDAVGTGKLRIALGSYASGSFAADATRTPVDITIDSSNNTLAGVRDAINASNAGVTASIINDGKNNYLSLTSKATGESSAMQITLPADQDPPASASLAALTFDGAGGPNMKQTVAAADAHIVVDSVDIYKPGNTITDAIQGVTLNLSHTTADGVSTRLSLDQDTAAIRTAIEGFVTAYNNVSKMMADATSYDAATGKAGTLNGDSTVRAIQAQLRGILGGAIKGAARGSATLPDIGITSQRDGTLAIDSAKLTSALSDPNKDLSALFASRGTNKGFGAQIDAAIGRILSPVGTLPTHTNSFNASIKDLEKQRTALNTRLDATEARYRAQFSALDQLMASMSSTSNYLMQQLASLTNNS
ncbi:flagellar filament capping protein FliD [Massilia norwichensis]|uniref:Flagellar hook-associated protein 2 n=1 Tax=Massilia norwichensis TaxID=1442366 RepID=A0ABT2A5L0_9BURK|nr:flagellar filament capping protein FliD [Massilia norwichensis]MCS0589478.1 flagellar filament capping protein FliD [Massilia norwichensis]